MAQSTVKLIVDAQNAVNPLRRVNEQTKALSKSTDRLKGRLQRSNTALRNKGRAAKSAAGGVRTLTGTLGPLLKALALIAATRFVFIQSAELETQRKSLEVLTGSLTKTNTIIKELQAFGSVTPFTSSELIEQTKRLKAFGFQTDELVDTTKRLANVAGATGADLQGIATAFGQIRAKGKLQQEENLQLLERGVDITTELKNITGLQGEAFEKAQRQGKIGADLVNQALINLTNEGGAFFGGATAQATTLNGKLSTLVDSVQNLARTLGEVLGPAFKFILDQATKAVQAIDNLFKRFQNIGKIGFGNVLGAENKAREDAIKLTQQKFGNEKFRGASLFASKEENKFFKEQLKTLTQQNIEREKLRQTEFTANEEKRNTLVETAQKNKEINNILGETNTKTDAIVESTKGIKTAFEQIGASIATGVSDALVGAIQGTKSLGEAAKGILNDISSQLLRLGINTLLAGFGGPFASLQGFAAGGRPPVGRPSIVGERGPELFVPSTAGTIIPNDKLGGGGMTNNIVVNVSMEGGVEAQGGEEEGRQLGRLIAVAVQSEIIQQKRAGGLLA